MLILTWVIQVKNCEYSNGNYLWDIGFIFDIYDPVNMLPFFLGENEMKRRTSKPTDSKELIAIEKKTMTSLEISELMKKDHFHVLRDIKKLINDDAIGKSSFGFSSYKSKQNKDLDIYKLDFEATMVLITGYDSKRRAMVIKRWMELENGEATPAYAKTPTNYLDALKQLVVAEEEKLIAEKLHKETVKELEYKEDVLDGLCKSIGLAEQRQILNQVVRFKGSDFRDRWRMLYGHFNMKYHMNLTVRRAKYDATHKHKTKSMLDFVDHGLGMLPELYEIALKLYESDIDDIINHYKDIY